MSTQTTPAIQKYDEPKNRTWLNRFATNDNLLYLLILVVIVQFSYPMTEGNSPLWLLGYQLLYMSLIVSGILVARDNPRVRRLLIILGFIWLIAGAAYTFNQEALWAQLAAYGSIAVFQLTVVWVLLKFIFRAKSVTRDVL
ncbi:MAG: hypothetical protein AAF702_51020 [Chloroflexota bacterium]